MSGRPLKYLALAVFLISVLAGALLVVPLDTASAKESARGGTHPAAPSQSSHAGSKSVKGSFRGSGPKPFKCVDEMEKCESK
jgi:uncharacterized membrane protein